MAWLAPRLGEWPTANPLWSGLYMLNSSEEMRTCRKVLAPRWFWYCCRCVSELPRASLLPYKFLFKSRGDRGMSPDAILFMKGWRALLEAAGLLAVWGAAAGPLPPSTRESTLCYGFWWSPSARFNEFYLPPYFFADSPGNAAVSWNCYGRCG